jgi:hypothetical protein
MTVVRWILWIAVGGAALWLFERFFGGPGIPEGIITPETFQDPGAQVGERGTGAARDYRVDSWRTTFTGAAEADSAMSAWRDTFGEDLIETATRGDKLLQTYVTLGDSCTQSGEQALTINNGMPAQAYCGGFPKVWKLL